MSTFTKIWNANRTGAQILADIQALGWNGLLVYLEEGSESADAPAGAGPKNGAGAGGIAAWGTQAGFASDGVDITGIAGWTGVSFGAFQCTGILGGGDFLVSNGLDDGTNGDDGIGGSGTTPTLGYAGGAGGAAGAGGGGGGGGEATLAGAGQDGLAGGAVNGGVGGQNGDESVVYKGGVGGDTSNKGSDATGGGGGGQGLGSNSPGLAVTHRTGASTRGGYVKIIGNVAAGGTPKSVGKMTGGTQSLAGGING